MIPILFGVIVVTFLMTRALPGNPALYRLGGTPNVQAIKEMEKQMGLDKPILMQFIIYVSDIIRGDFGYSYVTGRPVLDDLAQRFPATLELSLVSLFIATIVGVPLGVFSAVKRNKLIDHICRLVAVSGVSLPEYYLGLLAIYVFYFFLGWFPAPLGRIDPFVAPPTHITGLYILDSLITGNTKALVSSVQHVILPATTLGFVNMAPTARMTRSAMLEILSSDYIRTARACGIPEKEVIYKDALKNAMIPVLTTLGLIFGYLLGGIVVIERIFSWPGMGFYALDAMVANDHDPMQAYILISAIVFLLINLTVDVSYGLIDPRIKYK